MVSEETRKSIDEVNKKFMKGFKKEKASITASVYAEDAVLLPPGGDMIHGKKAIEEFWGGVMASGVKEAILNTVELSGSGDYLQEMGTGVLKIHPEGGEPAEQNAKYVVVWKRTSDGWRYKWDIWNDSP
jgi:uncharacterized protein (TIGR02246 family)